MVLVIKRDFETGQVAITPCIYGFFSRSLKIYIIGFRFLKFGFSLQLRKTKQRKYQ